MNDVILKKFLTLSRNAGIASEKEWNLNMDHHLRHLLALTVPHSVFTLAAIELKVGKAFLSILHSIYTLTNYQQSVNESSSENVDNMGVWVIFYLSHFLPQSFCVKKCKDTS